MKKAFLSVISLAVLIVFGFIVVGVVANPAAPAQHTGSLTTSTNVAGPIQVPLEFVPEAISYDISQPDYEWVEISDSSDEQLSDSELVDNVGSAEIDIGFYFPFFAGIYHQLRLSDNGYIYFGGEEADGSNTPQAIPSDTDLIHNFIAPFGADLFRYPDDSMVYVARQTEPERRLVLQYQNAYWCCNLESPNAFQIVLYPDGRILTQYQSTQSENPPHTYLTVGLENEDGTRGHEFYTGFLDETGILRNQLAVLYDPGNTVLGRILFIPNAVTVQGTPGQTVTLNSELLNLSGGDSSFTITHTLQITTPAEDENSEETKKDELSEEEKKSAWHFNILSKPELAGHTQAKPLTIAVTIPEHVVEGDTATITIYALPEAATGFTPTVTFTIEAIDEQE